MSDSSLSLLKNLALACGPPGAEGEVRQIVRQEIGGLGTISHDALGSVVTEGPGSGTRVVLDAHMDEVGFCVQSIDEEGRIWFVPLGGWWGHVLLAQRVDILASSGRKIPGSIGCKPPHFLTASERDKVLPLDQMYIDVAARDQAEVLSWGVKVGDAIAPRGHFEEMASPGRLCCKAFDDRVGVGVMIESFRSALAEKGSLPCQPIAVAAVQEEVGCRGAKTASHLSRPDLGIILEGTPADDLPGMPRRQAVLGHGPQIRFMDPTALSNRKLGRWTEALAEEKGIPVQIAVRRSGGTDASSTHLHGRGVPTIVIGVPARSIHTHSSIIDFEDYLHAIELVKSMLKELDSATVESFTCYDED